MFNFDHCLQVSRSLEEISARVAVRLVIAIVVIWALITAHTLPSDKIFPVCSRKDFPNHTQRNQATNQSTEAMVKTGFTTEPMKQPTKHNKSKVIGSLGLIRSKMMMPGPPMNAVVGGKSEREGAVEGKGIKKKIKNKNRNKKLHGTSNAVKAEGMDMVGRTGMTEKKEKKTIGGALQTGGAGLGVQRVGLGREIVTKQKKSKSAARQEFDEDQCDRAPFASVSACSCWCVACLCLRIGSVLLPVSSILACMRECMRTLV